MKQKKYVPVKKEDIVILKKNGCWTDDWKKVLVADGFDPKRVARTVFRGEVKLGKMDGEIKLADGVSRFTGIYDANLNNVCVGDNCSIVNVNGWLSNLDIEDGAAIENVGTIACTGETTFGNGHEIAVLNEGGGRELKITKETSAQIAYLSVLYRYNKEMVLKLNQIADAFCASIKSSRAIIGTKARVINCTEILNVNIGECAMVNGVMSLKEGTIDSSREAPTVVENGVIAEHFIFQKGSSVKDGAMLASTLIGEGTKIGKQFSSENSVMFANSEGFHSEVCSVFCGPYSVTHHRSTLLIAGLFSFYNAGSGTNQSNHMYKLGPLHQGILERGSKTGSFSYLLWPSKVGAFTAIIGKHYANFDTSEFPFSYLNEEDGKSTIVPGMNFFTVGTLRDGEKWPTRDRRKTSKKLDLIIFDVLSPFTGQKMIAGQKILMDLYEKTEKGQEYVTYKGVHIKRLLLKTCSRYYGLALDKYFGDVLLRRMEKESAGSIRKILKPSEKGADGNQEWIDLCGLICPKGRVDKLILEITSGKIDSFDKLQQGFTQIYDSYREDEWNWFLTHYKKVNGRELSEESNENILAFLESWKSSSLKLLNMVSNDASKEFEGNVRLGFGIDGNPDQDFEAVRGTFESNKFVKQLKTSMGEVEVRYEKAKKAVQ